MKRIFTLTLSLCILCISAAFAQAPSISYQGPQSYTAGVAIAPLTFKNTGGPVPGVFYAQSKFVFTNNSSNSSVGIVKDTAGNVYLSKYYENAIYKINPNGVASRFAGSASTGAVDGTGTAAKFSGPDALAIDANGFIYVSDSYNQRIRKISPFGVVTTFAGTGVAGKKDGAASTATFYYPKGLVFDKDGNLYVADQSNYAIRKITPDGIVSTLAGGSYGTNDGNVAAAQFISPSGLAIDKSGNIYVADNTRIRKITPAGVVTTFAGNNTPGDLNGTGINATFSYLTGLVFDAQGNLYASDNSNSLIRKITPAAVVTTLAGGASSGIDGIGTGAGFSNPTYLFFDQAGYLLVTEYGSNSVRSVNVTGYSISPALPAGLDFDASTGIISGTPLAATGIKTYTVTAYNNDGSDTATVKITVTGTIPNPTPAVAAPVLKYTGGAKTFTAGNAATPIVPTNTGGVIPNVLYGQTKSFKVTGLNNYIRGMVKDAAGNLYISDDNYHIIYKIDTAGYVNVFAGAGGAGFINGTAGQAKFNSPRGLAIDAGGNIYVADAGNNMIRKITPAGIVSTVAGALVSGQSDGGSDVARFYNPYAVAVDGYGNIYVADRNNHRIAKINPSGFVSTLAGGKSSGTTDGTGNEATFYYPEYLAVTQSGTVYVSEFYQHKIRKITPAGVVTTLAGSGEAGAADGAGTAAMFNYPSGLAVDLLGNIYVADAGNSKIRKITAAGVVNGLAGGQSGSNIDGVGESAGFSSPYALTIDAQGFLYVSDNNGYNTVRKVSTVGYQLSGALPAGLELNTATPSISGIPLAATAAKNYVLTGYNTGGNSSVTVSITVTGTPTPPATVAAPAISFGSAKTYTANTAISPLTPSNSGGAVPATIYGQTSTFAGTGEEGRSDGDATQAAFNHPAGIATDKFGNTYVADAMNNVIRKIAVNGNVTTLAGSTNSGSVDGTGMAASFSRPEGLAVDASGNVYVADTYNHLIRKITPAGVVTTVAGAGYTGFTNGTGKNAVFYYPVAVAVDASGNLYVADRYNHAIRKITPAGAVSTFAGSGNAGFVNGTGGSASFYYPSGVVVDAAGNLFVSDDYNHAIRKITSSRVVTTFSDNVTLGYLNGIAIDAAGNLFVTDPTSNSILKITPGAVVTTLAGSGTWGFRNGVGAESTFYNLQGIATDGNGNIYVADKDNNLIRKVSAGGFVLNSGLPPGLSFNGKTGTISGTPTLPLSTATYSVTAYNSAGSSTATVNITVNGTVVSTIPPEPQIAYQTPQNFVVGNSIAALSPTNAGGAVPAQTYAQVNTVQTETFGLSSGGVLDAAQNFYYISGYRIVKRTPAGFSTTLAGSDSWGAADGTGTGATFNSPQGLAIDAIGNIYVADTYNHMIRKITPAGVVTTVAGATTDGFTNANGTAARFRYPTNLIVDLAGNIYVSDEGNYAIRKIAPNGDVSTLAGTNASGFVDAKSTAARFSRPGPITLDKAGNIYVSDFYNNAIRKITPDGTVSTYAGSKTGENGYVDANATNARFYNPKGIAFDVAGNLYVADQTNRRVRKIATDGTVTTIAGNDRYASIDGIGTAASFSQLNEIVADNDGHLFTTDYNGLLRKINITGYAINADLPAGISFDAATGIISGTPLAATPAANYTVTAYNAGGSSSATINIAVTGTLVPPAPPVNAPNISYVTPQNFSGGVAITPLLPANSGGVVPAQPYALTSTLNYGTTNYYNGAITIDKAGNKYLISGNRIIKITPQNVVVILAGQTATGSANGQGQLASFNSPSGLAVDALGNIYVADAGNNMIRKITPGGLVSTLAGNKIYGRANGRGDAARFYNPTDLTIDNFNNIYVADFYNNQIRKITPDGLVTTLAGSSDGGTQDGTAASASFYYPSHIIVDGAGNLYVDEYGSGKIRKITAAGVVTTFVDKNTAGLGSVYGLAVDAIGSLFVADVSNRTVVKINAAGVSNVVAGNPSLSAFDGVGVKAGFAGVYGIAIDSAGNAFVTESGYTIRKINLGGYSISGALPAGLTFDAYTGAINGTPLLTTAAANYIVTAYNAGGSSSSTVRIAVTGNATAPALVALPAVTYPTPKVFGVGIPISPLQPQNTGGAVPAAVYGQTSAFVGSNVAGRSDGKGDKATFYNPKGMVADAYGNIFVADQQNHIIRKVTPDGVVTTFAGSGNAGFVNGTGTAASFYYPYAITIDKNNNLYVADQYNHAIRKITPTGVVTTLAGSGNAGLKNAVGVNANFYYPNGVAVDDAGIVYVSEESNYAVRKIAVDGTVTTLAGGSYGDSNGTGSAAKFTSLQSIAVSPSGIIYVSDYGRIRKITSAGVVTNYAGSTNRGNVDGTNASALFGSNIFLTSNASGDLYVADKDNYNIRKVTSTGVTTIAGNGTAGYLEGTGPNTMFNELYSITMDRDANLYVVDQTNLIRKVSVGGYTLNSSLPGGLYVNPLTGVISGTPQNESLPKDYTVLANNSAGTSIATSNIKVVYPPVLTPSPQIKTFSSMGDIPPVPVSIDSAITVTDLSRGTLAQGKVSIKGGFVAAQDELAFAGTSATGNIAGVYDQSTGVLTLTSASATATLAQWQAALRLVTYNNTNNVRPNTLNRTISFEVNDGDVTGFAVTKTVKLIYKPSSNANLTSLTFNTATLSPVFAPATTTYTANVGNAVSTLTVKPVTASLNAMVAVNGVGQANNAVSAALPLNVGNNVITVYVTAQDSVTTKTYTTNVYRKDVPVITYKKPANVIYGVADIKPAATTTNTAVALKFTSSNTAVATIVSNKIHVVGAGTTTIKVTQAGDDFYDAATSVSQVLTVDKAPLLVTSENKNKVYGTANPALTVTYSGFVNGESSAVLTSQAVAATTATTTSPVGSYAITASGAAAANYAITYTSGTLKVGEASLTIAVNNVSRTYGAANPSFSASYSGFVSGDSPASLSSQPTFSTIAGVGSPAGNYDITVGGATSANYAINYVAGTLTVEKAPLTITADSKAMDQGQALPAFTVSYAGFVNGETASSLLTPVSLGTTATSASPAGTYAITASGATANNYAISYVPGTLTVNSVALVFNPLPAKTYGDADFSPGATASGPITYTSNSTSVAKIVSGKISILKPGTVTITATSGGQSQSQTLTIAKAKLTITAENKSRSYGSANPPLTVVYSGFVRGDTAITTAPTVSTTAVATSGVGTYTIKASGAVSSLYTYNYVAGTLTVEKAPLTITADSKAMDQGQALPAFTASYAGFVNGETNAVLTAQPVISTAATSASPAGTYAITASGATANNYAISYVPGTLTVNSVALVFNPLPAKTYGDADFSPGATASGPITYTSNSTSVAKIVSGKISILKPGTVTITATSGGQSQSQTLTIAKAKLTITAENKSRSYGSANPPLTVVYSGFVRGDTAITTAPTVSTTAVATSGVGTYTIKASGAVSSLYTYNYVAGTLTVEKAPLTITADSKAMDQGQALPAFTASYAGFVNGETNAVLTAQPVISTAATSASPAGTYAITASGATANNYAISYVPGTLTVNSVALVFNPLPAKTYGDADFSPGATASGPITYTSNSTSVAKIVSGKISILKPGTVTITATSGGQSQSQTLTIAKAKLTITAENKSRSYGSANPPLTVVYSGFVRGDTAITTAPTVSTTAVATSGVGTYTIKASGAVSSLYTYIYVAGTLKVEKAPLTITADSKAMDQGQALPAFTASYAGFVNGETASSLLTPVSLGTTATSASPAGTYAITASGATANNYAISYVPGTLTINSSFTFAALPAKSYGMGDFDPGATSTATVSYSSSNVSVATIVSGKIRIIGAGSSVITATSGGVSKTQTLTVAPVVLTVSAVNKSKVYGNANPTLAITYSGFVNGETSTALSTKPAASTTVTTTTNAGDYAIKVSGGVASNYTFVYVDGTFSVTRRTLTITVNSRSKVYGSDNPVPTMSFSGFLSGETSAALTTQPSININATAASGVGTYSIKASGAQSPNYDMIYVDAVLTIAKKALAVTASNKTKVYGSANPVLTASYDGFVNGDDSSVFTSPLVLNTTATKSSSVGVYPITASGADAANYTITFASATISVTPTPLIITANNASKIYGDVNPALSVSYNGFVNGDIAADLTTQPTISTKATTTSATGTYNITPTGAASSNYVISYATGTLTIAKASLTITADSKTKQIGSVNPTLTVSYSGFVNGETTAVLTIMPGISTTATTSSPAGTYAITAVGAAAANYNISYVPGTLTITSPSFTFAALPAKSYGMGDFDPGATSTATVSYSSSNVSVATIVSGKIRIIGAGSSVITATSGGVSKTQTLTVAPVVLTVAAVNKTKVYGNANPTLAITYSGFVNGETSTALSTKPAASTTVTTTTNAGDYAIKVSGGVASNYTFVYVDGTFSVTRRTLTITVNSRSKVYGSDNPVPTMSFSGFLSGETSAALTTQPSININATAASGVGTYSIKASGAQSPNYDMIYVDAVLSVTPKALTITANNQSRAYGAADPVFTASYNGFVNGDTESVFTKPVTFTTTANSSSPQGGYPIIPAGAEAANYSITFVSGVLTITSASAPSIASFSPVSGPVGTLVTVIGTNFDNASSFTIGGKPAIIVSASSTKMVGMVMPGATSGWIAIKTFYGIANNNGYSVDATPYPGLQMRNKLVGNGSEGLGGSSQGFSVSVSADGNTAIVGGPQDNNALGAAWIYTRSGDTWTQQGTKLVGTGAVNAINSYQPGQGRSVSISADGNTAIVGGDGDKGGKGAAWIFTRTGNTWAQQGSKLVGSNATDVAFQGYSVCISADGNTAAIGGYGNNFNEGGVWVFTRSNGAWTQQGNKLLGTGTGIYKASQGQSVAISADGNTLVVGGPEDNAYSYGSAWVFTRTNGVWSQQGGKLIPNDGVSGSGSYPVNHGYSVSLSANGNTAIVGGIGDNDGVGAAWIYTRNGTTWTQDGAKLTGTAIGGTISGQGISVALSADGNTAAVGGMYDATFTGATWVYAKVGGSWVQQGAKLVGTGYSGAESSQGRSVSLSADGKTMFVGGYGDNNYTGAAWVFKPKTNVVAAAPNISYAGSLTFNKGTAVAAVSPVNSGGAVPAVIYGEVSTFAGNQSGIAGSTTGVGTDATFKGPLSVATDAYDNIYVADQLNNLIRKITPTGYSGALAGSTTPGNNNGVGSDAHFNHPTGVAVDAGGNVFVADQLNNLVRKITPAGVVTTFAGSGAAGAADGTGTAASFNYPTTLAFDQQGNLFVTDLFNSTIRKITPAGVVTTFAGSGTAGSADGTGTAASFNYPTGITFDALGNMFLADQNNHKIRKITATGIVTTVAGSGLTGSTNGPAASARFSNPYAVAVDAEGSIFVADYNNKMIRKITAGGTVSTLAGGTVTGNLDGVGSAATFDHPGGVALDSKGNLFVADYYNNKIRKVNVAGYTITPALPAGLTFDGTTGTISGTPTVASSSTAYTITAYNAAGSSSTTVSITVTSPAARTTQQTSTAQTTDSFDAPASEVTVHQALSPNGDGLNDVLLIDGLSNYADNNLSIVNASGTLIYHTTAYGTKGNVFDGHSSNGTLQKPGTYYYILEYKDGSATKRKTGYILIKY